jgi:uncharacterized protein (DUF433 family)
MHHPLGIPGIFVDPEIHGGQPVVETGIPVYLILDMLAQGFPRDEMERDYGVTDEHVRLALRFAAEYLKHEDGDAAPHRALPHAVSMCYA